MTKIEMSDLPYLELPPPPASLDGVSVLIRLVDGIGFRYRWATEGLRPEDLTFRPCEGAMTIGEVMSHLSLLLKWVHGSITGELDHEPEDLMFPDPPDGERLAELRRTTLDTVIALRGTLEQVGDGGLAKVTLTGSANRDSLPFWSMINGPLADSLTHVGQISSWRRMAGNPAPGSNPFRGTPPRG
jgi:hypothetical protein